MAPSILSCVVFSLPSEFIECHRNIYKITNVPKYRSFQYRILQRSLVTNVQLYKWDISTNELCYFCENEKETVLHLLFSCPEVQKMWREFIQLIRDRHGEIEIIISPASVLLNTITENTKYRVVNFMCLIVKQYIYSQRCLKSNLNIFGLKRHISKIENLEKYIAIKNQKSCIHSRKWLC